MNRESEVKRRLINEGRCDERLKMLAGGTCFLFSRYSPRGFDKKEGEKEQLIFFLFDLKSLPRPSPASVFVTIVLFPAELTTISDTLIDC